MIFLLSSGLIVCLTLCFTATPCRGQGTETEESDSISEDESISVASAGSPMGVRVYAPGRWGVVKVVANNPADEAGTIRVSVSSDDAAEIRYCRDLWMPAKSSRVSWIPIFMPSRQEAKWDEDSLPTKATDSSTTSASGPSVDSQESSPPADEQAQYTRVSAPPPAAASGAQANPGEQTEKEEEQAATGEPGESEPEENARGNRRARRGGPGAGHGAMAEPPQSVEPLPPPPKDILSGITSRVESNGPSKGEEGTYLAKLAHPGAMVYIDNRREPELRQGEKFLPYEAVLAMRQTRQLGRALSLINERMLPSMDEGWDSIRYAVLSGDRLDVDTAAIMSLRRWLGEGGSLWVQLNEVNEETMHQLLGGAYQVTEIDRVELTSFALDVPHADESYVPFSRESDQPEELIRVVVDNAHVIYEVNGWPAAFSFPYGEGQVLVTTLSAGAWIRGHRNGDPPYSDPRTYTDYMPTEAMVELAGHFFDAAHRIEISPDLRAEYVTNRIGYEIPSRTYVLAILLGFCGVLGLLGSGLAYLQKLEHFSWLAVLIGLVAAGGIVSAGHSSRQAVPPTVSSQQVVRVIPETGEYIATGTVAFYQPDQASIDVRTSAGTRIDPDLPKIEGKLRQMVWSDTGQWYWQDTTLPPGVQLVEVRHSGKLSHPLRAEARLTGTGIVGTIAQTSGEGEQTQEDAWDFSDGIVLFPHAVPMAAHVAPAGSFRAGVDDGLAEGQYFSDSLLSDEQRRRKNIFHEWISHYETSDWKTPMLLVWTSSLPSSLEWSEELVQNEAALVALPLELKPSARGEEVQVPASCIRVRAVPSEAGQSTAFSNRDEHWTYPNSQSTVTRLRFQLPATVLPLQLSGARLTIECNVPSRNLQIHAIDGDQRQLIFERTNAAGRLELEFSKEMGLVLDENGGVVLDFTVGDLLRDVEELTVANSGWTIRSTRLDVYGATPGAAGDSNDE